MQPTNEWLLYTLKENGVSLGLFSPDVKVNSYFIGHLKVTSEFKCTCMGSLKLETRNETLVQIDGRTIRDDLSLKIHRNYFCQGATSQVSYKITLAYISLRSFFVTE